MNTTRRCGCKSFNSCYLCEAEFGLSRTEPALERLTAFTGAAKVFCPACRNLFVASQPHICQGQGQFYGVELIENFVSPAEEAALIRDLDQIPWDSSQSGRRKQNYGPKANFKKRKVKAGSFDGFPACTKFVQDRFKTVPNLKDYKTVEQCSIEYRPETGARIDPHIDDCWVWGERIVQLNLLADSVLTLFPYKGDPYRYNLTDVAKYPKLMDRNRLVFNPFEAAWADGFACHELPDFRACADDVIRIPLPRRSLLLLHGPPRYDWEHCIMRCDIKSRRVVIAYREFTPTYLPGGPEQSVGREILEKARNFF